MHRRVPWFSLFDYFMNLFICRWKPAVGEVLSICHFGATNCYALIDQKMLVTKMRYMVDEMRCWFEFVKTSQYLFLIWSWILYKSVFCRAASFCQVSLSSRISSPCADNLIWQLVSFQWVFTPFKDNTISETRYFLGLEVIDGGHWR